MIYNERGAEQADTVLQPIIQSDTLKSSHVLLDLDFVIRSELGDASIFPATTRIESLEDAVTCWAQILKLENSDPLKARRLAELLVQYSTYHPSAEFPPMWIERARDISSRSHLQGNELEKAHISSCGGGGGGRGRARGERDSL